MKTTGITGQWKANLVRRSDIGPFLEANVQQANGDFVCQVYGGKPDTVRTADEADTIARAIAEVPAMIVALSDCLAQIDSLRDFVAESDCDMIGAYDAIQDADRAQHEYRAILRRIEGGE